MNHKKFYNNWCSQNGCSVSDLVDDEITVIWSGGCDSTALLYCLANLYPFKTIYARSIYLKEARSKDIDKKNREKLKKIFQKQGLNIDYVETVVDVENGMIGNTATGGLAQPMVWLSMLSLINNSSTICFGYIRGDDIWHYIENFKGVFNNMAKLNESAAKLCLPLEWTTKEQVLEYLDTYNLLKYCNWCECDTPCGTCKDCISIEHYNRMKLENSYNKEKKKVRKKKELIKC